jgi:BarA-like signal transduction histidine kinase
MLDLRETGSNLLHYLDIVCPQISVSFKERQMMTLEKLWRVYKIGFYLVVKLPVRSKVEHLEGQCPLLLRWLLQIVTLSMNSSLLAI